jgi:hypothetical protein
MSKKSQLGYFELDLKGVFIELIIVVAVIGAVLAWLLPWLWRLIKPIIQQLIA